jgi:hypothetical protein
MIFSDLIAILLNGLFGVLLQALLSVFVGGLTGM